MIDTCLFLVNHLAFLPGPRLESVTQLTIVITLMWGGGREDRKSEMGSPVAHWVTIDQWPTAGLVSSDHISISLKLS